MTYDSHKLETPSHFSDEVDEIETEEISNPLDEILDITARLKKYDRKEIERAFKIILNYSNEPGIQLTDVNKLLQTIIDEI
jgi:hypothetical protein